MRLQAIIDFGEDEHLHEGVAAAAAGPAAALRREVEVGWVSQLQRVLLCYWSWHALVYGW